MNKELFKKDPVIKHLQESGIRLILVGGAVNCILRGKTPKDYDFLASEGDIDKLYKIEGISFDYSSMTAMSFRLFGKYKIQMLRKSDGDFPFTIEQARYDLKYDSLRIDEISFDNSVLIPNHSVYLTSARPTKKEFKNRVKKWKSKGYNINPITYSSYLSVCKKNSIFDIFKFNSSSDES